jgi:hypothetical protein
MAWSITTYAGTQGTGSPSGWRTAMFELCRAINEREDVTGGFTAQQFYKADGTQARHITMADLLGMAMVGEDSYFKLNCERIMAWIKANCDSYSETSGLSDAWTVANLEADVGAVAFFDSPLRNTHALFFQQCQDALDRLIYAALSRPFSISGLTKRVRESTVTDTDMEVVWDSAVADASPSTTAPIFSPNLGIEIKRQNPVGADPAEYFNARIEDDLENVGVSLSGMSGTMTYAGFSYTFTSEVDGGGALDVTFGANSFSGSLGADDSSTTGISADLSDFVLGSVNYFDMDITVPATSPLDALPSTESAIYTGGINCALSASCSVYFDIASELTDQA